nr:unnamed protein product [Spirometra erinaceieuropaei]
MTEEDEEEVLEEEEKGAGNGRGEGADNCDELGLLKRQAQSHQSSSRPADAKGEASVALVWLWMVAPKEGVAGTHLLQLAFFGIMGLAE